MRDIQLETESFDLNYEAHMARVDGQLLALEDRVNPPEDESAFTLSDVATAPEFHAPPSQDRLTKIILAFALNAIEADLLRLAAAAELSPALADTFAKLQGDRRLRRPQVSLALQMLEHDAAKRHQLMAHLAPSSPLFTNSIIELRAPWKDRSPLYHELELALPQALLLHLSGLDQVEEQWQFMAELKTPTNHLGELKLADPVREAVQSLARLGDEPRLAANLFGPPGTERLFIQLQGAYGTGRKSVVESIAALWNVRLLIVDLRNVPGTLISQSNMLKSILRDCKRLCAVPLFMHLHECLNYSPDGQVKPDPSLLDQFLKVVKPFNGPVFFSGESSFSPDGRWSGRQLITLDLSNAGGEQERESLWWRALSAIPANLPTDGLKTLSQRFQFTPGQIEDAVAAAQGFAATREPRWPVIEMADLKAGCLAQLRHNLESLSRKARGSFTWDDLILPDETISQLRMFSSFIQNREKVYEQWGMSSKSSSGKGLKSLFFGASGTGKTLAAQVLSSILGIDLFKVDLSTLVSKWVGETEKNLDKVFTEAEKSHAIILFDEADSLFGKRGSVEKGTDRYSNMEVNYLLQRFDEYDGVVILTSNFPRGIDDAFSRRMHFMIQFPTPDPEMRGRLWRTLMPPELPKSNDIDFQRLADGFELSGGNIKNAILGASFIAAENNTSVRMVDLMQAIQWEYQKIGRTSSRSEFQEYFDQLQ